MVLSLFLSGLGRICNDAVTEGVVFVAQLSATS